MSSDTTTTDEPTPDAEAEEAPPRDDEREALVVRLTEVLGDALVETHIRPGDDLWVRVARDSWQETGRLLRDRFGCRYFSFISAIDWLPSPFGRSLDSSVDKAVGSPDAPDDADVPDTADSPDTTIVTGYAGGDTRFQLLARVENLKDGWGLTLKVDLPDDDLRIDTWIPNYAGANWHERETHEMFGITFTGHPYLRNLYLPGAFEGYPLRKDFPLIARLVKPWPGIVDVEEMPPLPEEEGEDSASEASASEDGASEDGASEDGASEDGEAS